MGARSQWTKLKGTVLVGAVLCLASASSALPAQNHKKTKKPLPPPLPSGPTGPVQQVPLDSIAAETGIEWHITPLAIERQGASVAPNVSSAR